MKRLKIVLLSMILFTFVVFDVIAQPNVDVVVMKNGDVYKGNIIKDVPGDYLQIEELDGTVSKLKYADIKQVNARNNGNTSNPNPIHVQRRDTTAAVTSAEEGFELRPKSIEADLFMFNFNYTEIPPPDTVKLKSSENGLIEGLNIGVETSRNYPFHVFAKISYSSAKEIYDGTLLNGAPLKTSTISTFWAYTIGISYTIPFSKRFSITPSLSYETRSWDRNLTGQYGYEEFYSWVYIPIGLRFDYKLSDKTRIGLNMQFKTMTGGNVSIINGGSTSFVLDLGTHIGGEISLPISFSISKVVDINLIPFCELYGFSKGAELSVYGQDSTGKIIQAGAIWEPASFTNIFGVKLGATIAL